MALTSLQIDTDKAEYSRLEPTRSTVKVRVIPTPAANLVEEAIVVSLVKQGVTIWSTPVVFSGTDCTKGQVVQIDLTNVKDAAGITHINRGNYSVEATQANVIATKTFSVAMITAAEMRKSYCQGLHLISGYKLAAKRQPALITGVTIVDVSKGSRAGVFALSYDSTAQTLTWNGGPAIDIAGSENAILIDAKGNWVEVEIDPYELPATGAAEGILLAEEALDDNYLRSEIEKATQEAEILLKVRLEPTRIATDPYYSAPKQGEYFDYQAMPMAYQQRDFNLRALAWQVNIPYNQVANIGAIEGYIGNTQALTITDGAITVNRKSGILNILPYNSQNSYLYTFFLTFNFWGVREFIPDFWRYKGTIGIEEKTPGDIQKLVGMIAAQSVLITAEQAYRAGTTSKSISKDGVSRSESYNAKGIYDTTIQEYKDWVAKNAPRLRNQYRGIPCVVM
jgi:hypothetical protein